MTTQPAPLLTAEMAEDLLFRAQRHPAELGALADGRTRCIQPFSEEEHREKCRTVLRELALTATNGFTYEDIWLACARAMGAIR